MDPVDLLALVRRRWLPLVLCVVIGIVGGLVVTATTPKSYRASARLFVNIPVARGVQEALQGVQLSSQLLASYAEIGTSRAVAERISQKLDQRFSPGEIRSKLSTHPRPETLLVDVDVVDEDPASARDIANAGAATITEVIAELEAGKAGAVEARIVDPATLPTSPISPRPRYNLAIGLVLGLGAGLALAGLLNALDKSITSSDQAKLAYGAPVLAVIPRHRRSDQGGLVAMDGANSAEAEAYRSLRTSIRFVGTQDALETIVVTSAEAAEGKSTVAANLAIAIAQSGERVIVIDADLRKPKLGSFFGVEVGAAGLTEVVFGQSTLDAALVPWRGSLSILPTGALPPNPSEVLGSESMAKLLAEAAAKADVVVIDTAPLLPVTDAAVLGALADGVLIVSRWGVTQVAAADEARFVLAGVSANVIGVALNGVRGLRSRNYYQERARR